MTQSDLPKKTSWNLTNSYGKAKLKATQTCAIDFGATFEYGASCFEHKDFFSCVWQPLAAPIMVNDISGPSDWSFFDWDNDEKVTNILKKLAFDNNDQFSIFATFCEQIFWQKQKMLYFHN